MPLHPRADDGIRTRDPHLGKVMRYQLRYIRILHRGENAVPVRCMTIMHDGAETQIPGSRTRLPHESASCAVLVFPFDASRVGRLVPWLSGRASASHAEGRWFDPSRDHHIYRIPARLSIRGNNAMSQWLSSNVKILSSTVKFLVLVLPHR